MKSDNEHIFLSPDGISSVDSYLLERGIMLSYNQIYSDTWGNFNGNNAVFSSFTINICLNGRCDVSLGDGKYTIVTKNHVAVSTIRPDKDFYYPGKLYEGIALMFDYDTVAANENSFLSLLGIDITALKDYFCGRSGLYYHDIGGNVLEIARKIRDIREETNIAKLRFLSAALLYELLEYPPLSVVFTFFTKGQLAIVKKAERIISADLSVRHSAKEMAEMFGISESSFKLYFKGVFGMNYLDYFRKMRMQKAAELLENTPMKVAEIALTVGYENQGKFAKAFSDEYGTSPMEFRRLSK